jgi:hypothetical protein
MLSEREILDRFEKVRRNSAGWLVSCPAHPDSTPSLSIRLGNKGWLLHCFAGCAAADVIAAAGLTWDDLFKRDCRCR